MVEQASVSVVPGETATARVRVRNTGTVVDSYSLTVLGQPAAWTTVVPAALSLFPGADGTMELHFAPPRTATVGAGPQPFGVRVVGTEDPDNPMVEEGELNLLPFVEVAAKLTPRTSETKRKSKHEIVIDNKGNSAVGVHLSVSDPDEQLAFELSESNVTVDAGQSRHVPVKVIARKGFARGSDKHRPFQAKVTPEGSAFPITLDGNLIQKAGLPRFVVPLVAGVVALALIAAVLPGMLNKDAKGNLQLTAEQGATATVPTGEEGEGEEDPNAPATAEEAEAAAAAELAANGKDGDGGAAGGSGGGDSGGATDGGTSAAGAVTGAASGSGGSTSDGATATTAARQTTSGGTTATTTTAPTGTAAGTSGGSTGGSTTTTAAPAAGTQSTTTTVAAKPTSAKFHGPWVATDGNSKMTILVGSSMQVQASGAVGSFTCVGSVADADDDGTFTAGKCSDGSTRTVQYLSSTDQVRVSFPGSICPRTGCFITFNRN